MYVAHNYMYVAHNSPALGPKSYKDKSSGLFKIGNIVGLCPSLRYAPASRGENLIQMLPQLVLLGNVTYSVQKFFNVWIHLETNFRAS